MGRPSLSSLFSMLPGAIGALAFALSLFACAYCEFLSFSSDDDGGGDGSDALHLGIWNYQGTSVVQNEFRGAVVVTECFNFPDGINIDGRWRSARAFSSLSLVIGGVVTFWALLVWCIHPSKRDYKRGAALYLACCLFQGLSLLMLGSNACHDNSLLTSLLVGDEDVSVTFPSSCSIAGGAKCAIAATVFWLAAAIAAVKVNPPERAPITTQMQTVTYTRTVGNDGAAVVSQAVVKGEPIVVGEQGGAEKAI